MCLWCRETEGVEKGDCVRQHFEQHSSTTLGREAVAAGGEHAVGDPNWLAQLAQIPT